MTKIYGQDIVDEAMKYRGKPYLWGGNGPDEFDCSGFVLHVLRTLGNDLPDMTASDIYLMCKRYYPSVKIAEAAQKPGSLVFMRSKTNKGICHVGIVGKNGTWEARGHPYSKVGKWPWRDDWVEAGLIPGIIYEDKPKEKEKGGIIMEALKNWKSQATAILGAAFVILNSFLPDLMTPEQEQEIIKGLIALFAVFMSLKLARNGGDK